MTFPAKVICLLCQSLEVEIFHLNSYRSAEKRWHAEVNLHDVNLVFHAIQFLDFLASLQTKVYLVHTKRNHRLLHLLFF